jgi:rhamnulokinase
VNISADSRAPADRRAVADRGAVADRRAVVAVDLGAQSCRVSLLRWTEDRPSIQLVHRIANAPVAQDGRLRWDLSAITTAADEGLRRSAVIAEEGIAAIGVTGWAVDYVRLRAGQPIADPFCYRDARTGPAMDALHKRIPPERLYALTGIQVLPLNTLYQLYADGMAGVPHQLRWLNLPEYMLYRWGAQPVAEYTNATHTGMVALGRLKWSPEIFSAAGLDPAAAPEIVPPGSIVGRLQGPLSNLPALRNTVLIAPACHDTASAIAGIPAQHDDWAYISSGTWSLVGTLLDKPCAGVESARLNFTNLGAVGGKTCFLRNVNGLWLLNQCMDAWQAAGERQTVESLIDAAAQLPAPKFLIDVDDPDLLAPGNMPKRICAQLQRSHGAQEPPPCSPPEMTNLILHSLAARYATVLRQAAALTGKQFKRLYLVGGGSKNSLLNRLTKQATGLELICGAQESATLGNFSVQLAALEKINQEGVNQDAVARWAAVLAASPLTAHPLSEMDPQYAAQIPEENHI